MTNQDTPTPRTDAMAVDQVCCDGEYNIRIVKHFTGDYVLSDDARTLERELTAARAEVEALRAALKLCAAVCAGETTTKADLIAALEAARAALSKEKP